MLTDENSQCCEPVTFDPAVGVNLTSHAIDVFTEYAVEFVVVSDRSASDVAFVSVFVYADPTGVAPAATSDWFALHVPSYNWIDSVPFNAVPPVAVTVAESFGT